MFFDFHHHHPTHVNGIYNLNLGESPANGFFSAGIHPQEISKVTESDWIWLEKMSVLPNCISIGECGLDGMIAVSEEQQEAVFSRQIHLATSVNKPMTIHCVRRFSQILHFYKTTKIPFIIHGFNKKSSVALPLLEKGIYLSFGEAVLHHVSLQKIVADTPINQLFLETDNSSFEIDKLYEKVAELKKISVENLSDAIQGNFTKLRNL